MPVDHYPNPGALPPIAPGVPSELPVVPRATVWPRRLGILAIVVGVLGVLGGVMGSSVATQTKIIEVLLPKDVTADPQAVRTAAAWKAGVVIAGTVLSAPLLAAGIGLVRRRRWGVRLAMIWAVLGIGWSLFSAAVDVLVDKGIATASGLQARPISTGIVLSLVFNLALPAFLLIWFARGEIREEVATWR